MKQTSMVRMAALVVTLGWVCCMLWASDAQMRESDQASLLTGAVEFARGEADWVGDEYYNYDKQYLSYWIVAAALKMTNGGEPGAAIPDVVRVSNLTATLVFSAGLLGLVLGQRRWSWLKLGVLVCVLLSPVMAFSGMLLSSNLISGGLVLLLALVLSLCGRDDGPDVGRGPEAAAMSRAAFGGIRSRVVHGLVFVLSFAAAAARQDVMLLAPLLAVLAGRRTPRGGVFGNPAAWMLGGGVLMAIVVGRMLDPHPTPLPRPFFAAPTFFVYLAGGLGAGLLAVLVFSWRLYCQRAWDAVLAGSALLVPLVFYSFFLYTPRHMFPTALALALSVLMSRGDGLWTLAASTRFQRALIWTALLGSVIPWFVGVRMNHWTQGRIVCADSSLYPTADGFWPMGAYGSFFGRLAAAAEDSVDHNQEVWGAWGEIDAGRLPPGKGAIVSSGLTSFGLFALSWHRVEAVEEIGDADFVLFDDRTLSKQQRTVNQFDLAGQRTARDLLVNGSVKVIGRSGGRNVLLWSAGGADAVVDEHVSLRVSLSEIYGGNDFRLDSWADADWKSRDWAGHRVVLAARSRDDLDLVRLLLDEPAGTRVFRTDYDTGEWHALEISGKDLGGLLSEESLMAGNLWVACSMLPAFMDVRKYGK